MVELGTSSTFRGWVRVRVLGYGSGVRGRKVKSRDCALASDLVRAVKHAAVIIICQDRRRCGQKPGIGGVASRHIDSDTSCNCTKVNHET